MTYLRGGQFAPRSMKRLKGTDLDTDNGEAPYYHPWDFDGWFYSTFPRTPDWACGCLHRGAGPCCVLAVCYTLAGLIALYLLLRY